MPSGKETVLHTVDGSSGDGYAPYAGLINVNGTLYGTTVQGGAYCTLGCGTVFSITTSGTETVLHSFGPGDGEYPYAGLIDVNGTLYGTTLEGGAGAGTIFSITPSGTEKVLYGFAGEPNGFEPYAGLINVKGTLYGTTAAGGVDGDGTVFSLSP
jgi:uncharacterized repeat protein (TIGR03803 family)